jgi:hypothetical protein
MGQGPLDQVPTADPGLDALDRRFWDKVEKTSACWLWLAQRNHRGYGRFWIDGALRLAHRVAYGAANGPIPKGLQLDHLCRNRACVRPDHLEPVTSRENTLRGEAAPAVNARKSACDKGHPFTPDNTNVRLNGDRRCRTCHAANNRAWRARHAQDRKTA